MIHKIFTGDKYIIQVYKFSLSVIFVKIYYQDSYWTQHRKNLYGSYLLWIVQFLIREFECWKRVYILFYFIVFIGEVYKNLESGVTRCFVVVLLYYTASLVDILI